MIKNAPLICVLGASLLSGCATRSIRTGKDLSTSGIAYSDAVENLLDVTTDRIIDFDNEELKKTRRGSNLREMITEQNEAVTDVLAEIEGFRIQTKLLKAYFLNLQALSDSPFEDDAGMALKSLSDSISKSNKLLEGGNGTETLTENQKTQIGALGGLVAKTVLASQIRRALERDAEIIGTYLALQENQLRNISEMLRNRFLAENDLFLEEKVIAPYVDTNNKLPSDWANDRKKWFKTRFINEKLATAEEAAKQLRGVWADILEGKSDIDSLSVLISDINEFVTAAQALKTSSINE